jgi:ATP-dependent Clp protease protease subunit
MKLNKMVLGLFLILTITLIPSVSVSKDDKDTIVLSKDNTLVLNSEVNGDSVGALILKAKELDNNLSRHFLVNKDHLYLFLNTPGGSIQSGLELIEALNGMGRPVDTITSFAASMGFQIAQNLNERLILKSGIMMSHHAAGQIEGSFGGVHPSQMDNRYQLWIDRMRELDEQTVKRTNGKQTYESYIQQYDKEMWLGGTKSVAQGYSDRIVTVKCDKSLAGTTTHQANFLGMPITYELDNCPLNTAPLNVSIGAVTGTTNEFKERVKQEFLSDFHMKAFTPSAMAF